jgi:hypothetical protein
MLPLKNFMAQADGCTPHPRLAMVPSAPAVFHSDICFFFLRFTVAMKIPGTVVSSAALAAATRRFPATMTGAPVLIQLPEEIRDDCRGERTISREINKLLTKI